MKTFLTVIITAAVTSLLWLGVLVAAYFYLVGTTELPFQVSAQYPTRVKTGEQFAVEIQVANPTADPMTIDSVDVYHSFLSGFKLINISPEPSSSDDVLDFTTYAFSASLESGQTTFIVLTLEALTPGYFAGDIDICTPNQDYTTIQAGIVIEPAD